MRGPYLVAALLAPGILCAQGRTGALAGTVRDTLGHPIRLAGVLVGNTELAVVTDDSGRFHLKGIPAGRRDFTVRKIGYASVEFTTTLAADSTLVLDVRMKQLSALPTVTVTGEGLKRFESTGFGMRRQMGLGTFVTPARVDSMSSIVGSPSQLLRGLPGVELVNCGPLGCRLRARIGPQCLNLFVNGGWRDGQLDENVQLSEVYAIEFYPRPVLVPSEFQGKLPQSNMSRTLTLRAGCGAVAVWTRSRAAP
jgi:hypothetical protein